MDFDVSPLLDDKYLEDKYKHRKVNKKIVFMSILKRIFTLLFKAKNYDLVFIEKEIIPYFPPVLEYYLYLKKIPFIVDYDDAIWHEYDENKNKLIRFFLKNKIKTVMKLANYVIGGSEYIIRYAMLARAKNIKKIPTVIDLNKYKCNNENKKSNSFIIGWIGSPATSKYILELNDVLEKFTNNFDSIVHLIGFDESLSSKISFKYKIIKWDEKTEVKEMCLFDVGIMPLINNNFEKGKCGLKLIQYMGCRKPVIASPIGENKLIVEHGINGFLAKNKEEWYKYLLFFYKNRSKINEFGEKGYMKVANMYSLEKAKDDLIKIIELCFRNNRKT